MSRKLAAILTNLGHLILIGVITLILLELALGITFRIRDRKLIDAEAKDYPYLYFILKQDTNNRNEDGLKILRKKEKPENSYRIVLSGGSVAYGQKLNETISANLEKILKDSFPKNNIEVLNGGVPAYVIEQEFILIQLILQYYQPDMIISLDGYNDLISTEINRYYHSPDILAPHNWRDFRHIRHQEKKARLSGRFYGIFPNIYRARDFFFRRNFDKEFEYSKISNNKELIAQTYARRVDDIHAFCSGKSIHYHHFLQPVRFTDKQNNTREEHLYKIYTCMNDSLNIRPYNTSLLNIFRSNNSVFKDECHVISTGNNIFAKEISNKIIPILKEEIQSSDTVIH
jgi:hypothetical protein